MSDRDETGADNSAIVPDTNFPADTEGEQQPHALEAVNMAAAEPGRTQQEAPALLESGRTEAAESAAPEESRDATASPRLDSADAPAAGSSATAVEQASAGTTAPDAGAGVGAESGAETGTGDETGTGTGAETGTGAAAAAGVRAGAAGASQTGRKSKAPRAPRPPKEPKRPKAAKPATQPKRAEGANPVAIPSERASAGRPTASSGRGRRSVARTGLRIATSVVVLALGAATVGAAAVLSLPTVAAGVPSVVVTPTASDQTRVCPGPYLGQADASATSSTGAPTLVSVGTPTLVTGIVPTSNTITTSTLASPDALPGAAKPTELTAPGSSGTLLGGSQSQQLKQADVTGLATSECSEASADSWLAAGSTITGRTSYLVLSNPTAVVSTVNLSIFSEAGVVNAPGTSGITVQPHSQRALSLAGFAPNVVSPVIHVQASGGTVLASLQQSVIRGLAPGGIDVAGPTGAPALQQTIAGVQIVSTSAIAEQAADPASADLAAALRVYVPGSAGATLTVTMKSETLGVADTTASYSATGGVVTDFPFPSVTDDTYSVIVSSDQPVVVGARSAVVSGGTDFAWYQSGPPVSGTFLFATATGPNPRLQLVNTGNADAAVSVSQSKNSSAAPVTLTVAANSAAGVSLSANTAYTVVTSQPLTASVGYLGDGLISAFSVSPASPLAAPITIYGG